MKIIYKTATSFNGYIADQNQSLQWLFDVSHDGADDNSAFLDDVGAIVEGSHTYEWVLRETDMLSNPDQWRHYFGERTVFIFTSRDLPVPNGANVKFLHMSVADASPTIREAAHGKNAWVVGGGELAAQFIDAAALDEIHLTMAPVALDSGAPLLPRRLESSHISLQDVRRQGQFVELRYTLQY